MQIQITPQHTTEQECHCFDGWHYIGVEEDGEEHTEAVRCRRCNS
jgi:hypothetical protein